MRYFEMYRETRFPKGLTKGADFWTGPAGSARADHTWLPGRAFDYASLDGPQVPRLPYTRGTGCRC
ncbi:MAG: hypothetical protein MPJ06_09365 [Nitrosopumilus sp.]|nr:hypothetical protein [Nitrosopumilus sp.]MDA7944188.1 hypothetical protein [Nitrosopumilus sp.]MDA7960492.1 hypothetical protein [Nitrosopumilus sp.]MDA7999667.1 hypothetical protein [Nitrosopumilus sp.]